MQWSTYMDILFKRYSLYVCIWLWFLVISTLSHLHKKCIYVLFNALGSHCFQHWPLMSRHVLRHSLHLFSSWKVDRICLATVLHKTHHVLDTLEPAAALLQASTLLKSFCISHALRNSCPTISSRKFFVFCLWSSCNLKASKAAKYCRQSICLADLIAWRFWSLIHICFLAFGTCALDCRIITLSYLCLRIAPLFWYTFKMFLLSHRYLSVWRILEC